MDLLPFHATSDRAFGPSPIKVWRVRVIDVLNATARIRVAHDSKTDCVMTAAEARALIAYYAARATSLRFMRLHRNNVADPSLNKGAGTQRALQWLPIYPIDRAAAEAAELKGETVLPLEGPGMPPARGILGLDPSGPILGATTPETGRTVAGYNGAIRHLRTRAERVQGVMLTAIPDVPATWDGGPPIEIPGGGGKPGLGNPLGVALGIAAAVAVVGGGIYLAHEYIAGGQDTERIKILAKSAERMHQQDKAGELAIARMKLQAEHPGVKIDPSPQENAAADATRELAKEETGSSLIRVGLGFAALGAGVAGGAYVARRLGWGQSKGA